MSSPIACNSASNGSPRNTAMVMYLLSGVFRLYQEGVSAMRQVSTLWHCRAAKLDQGALLDLADTLGRHSQAPPDLAQRQFLAIEPEPPLQHLAFPLRQRRKKRPHAVACGIDEDIVVRL